jgi:hypothetical protein
VREPLRADDVGGPVAPAADRVEGQIGRALVLPSGDAFACGSARTHDEFPTGIRVREDTDVEALGLAVLQHANLYEQRKDITVILPLNLLFFIH